MMIANDPQKPISTSSLYKAPDDDKQEEERHEIKDLRLQGKDKDSSSYKYK